MRRDDATARASRCALGITLRTAVDALVVREEPRPLRRFGPCPNCRSALVPVESVWDDPDMQHAFGMTVPESVAEMCQPVRAAVLVYDAQVGILAHVRDRDVVLANIRGVIDAARGAGVPVVYVRHVSVPPSHMGVGALRTAMAWQRVDRADQVQSSFPPDASHSQLVEELKPATGEPVLEKLAMSAFVGTPLEVVLRDRGVTTLILVGAVLEIGIEPTARHAADLGLLPVVVEDACGVVEPEAAQRSLASLDYSLMSYRATTAEVVEALSTAPPVGTER
jgi:biuret amidohydrolase